MSVEEDIKKNTADIHALTVNVTRIATIVENSEKRHESDMDVMREAVQGISRLNERMTATIGLEKDVATLKEDVRIVGHDVKAALNGLQGIPVLNEKLSELGKHTGVTQSKVEALEAWRINADSARANADKLSAEHTASIEMLRTWKTAQDGGDQRVEKVGKWFWTIFGGAITVAICSFGYWLLQGFVEYQRGRDAVKTEITGE